MINDAFQLVNAFIPLLFSIAFSLLVLAIAILIVGVLINWILGMKRKDYNSLKKFSKFVWKIIKWILFVTIFIFLIWGVLGIASRI